MTLTAEYSGFRVEGDATEFAVLKQARMDKADIVIGATHDDNVNMMIAQVAQKVFHVPKVIVRVVEPRRIELCKALGVECVCPTSIGSDMVLRSLQESPSVAQDWGAAMNTLIVGGGKLVYFLSRTFSSKGYQVTIVNRDRAECVWLARQLKATVVYGDGSDPRILEEAQANGIDTLLAVTPHDEDNLAICQLARLRFGVPRTLALVNDPDNEDVFRKLGVTTAFSTTRLLSNLIEQKAAFEDITSLAPLADGKVNITEVVLRDNSPVVGRTLMEIGLPPDSLIAGLIREEHPIIPRGITTLQARDRLIVITLPENHGRVLKMLTGDTT